MTAPIETPPEIDADATESPTEGNDTGEPDNGAQTPDVNKSLAEANTRYRTERDEARTERDALAETLTELQIRELYRLAGEHLANPEDIDLSGNELSHYLTPEGWVDRDAVADAAADVVASRPGLSKNSPVYDPLQGHGNPALKDSPSWGDLLKP